jgi:LemA protein
MRRRGALLLLAVAGGLTTGCGYNRIQQLDERASGAQGQIETQLQRRADLIGNLVNTVKGYAQHEEKIFTEIANARAALLGSVKSGDPEQMANANAQFSGALGRLLAIQENYPNLKADQGFRQLQDQLEGTENRIATARTDYNQAVNDYNAYIRSFPQAMTAKVTGAKPRKYFTASAGAQEVPNVDFSRPGQGAPPGSAAPAPPAGATAGGGAKSP